MLCERNEGDWQLVGKNKSGREHRKGASALNRFCLKTTAVSTGGAL